MYKKIKIGYFADGPWSHIAFKKMIKDESLEILFIVPRKDTNDTTLKQYAKKYAIDYLFPVEINSQAFIQKAKEYNCDLFISMSFNQIFRKIIINTPKLGIINCHAGKLPAYRGRNVLNWVLINDESEFGITVHYVDEGIDTGDIIAQKTFPITDEDSYKSLLEIAYFECADLLYESIKKIQLGQINSKKQDINKGFYCGRRTLGDEVIDWNQNSRVLFNFIRSINDPGPRATTNIGKKTVKINKSIFFNDAVKYIGTPGQILSKTEFGFLIKTKDTYIEILEIDTDCKLKVGDKLGK